MISARATPPPTRAEIIAADVREAVTGSRERPRAAEQLRASTRELLAITRHRNQARDITGGNAS
jgi:hypothetical protein